MGVKNYVLDGVSCAGKTTVCDELQRRGFHAIHGDRELAYWGDAETGKPLDSTAYEHWIWDIDKVRALVADQAHAVTFLCGGCRNLHRFIHLVDGVLVLEIDEDTLNRRLALRPDSEWGGSPEAGALNARLQHAKNDYVADIATIIDGTAAPECVVDAILQHCGDLEL